MEEINSFSDRDVERIGGVVRYIESKVDIPFDKRPPPVSFPNVLIHVRTKGACTECNPTTGQMFSVLCDVFKVNPASGALTDLNYDITVWNPTPKAIPASLFTVCMRNDYNMYVFVTPTQFDVRVKPGGTALQKSFDGGVTWIDWATIGGC